MKTFKEIKEEVTHKDFGPMMDSFVSFASDKLGIKSLPNINYKKNDQQDIQPSFGGYNPSTNNIDICTKNRHPMDVLRTIAHELVHHKQNEDGRIKDVSKEGATGSPVEDEANSMAGKLMRWFGKENPDKFMLSHIIEQEQEQEQEHLDFDKHYGKTFRITDSEGDPNREGFSLITPENGGAWSGKNAWKDRPEYENVVRDNFNKPGWLGHKHGQITRSYKNLGINEELSPVISAYSSQSKKTKNSRMEGGLASAAYKKYLQKANMINRVTQVKHPHSIIHRILKAVKLKESDSGIVPTMGNKNPSIIGGLAEGDVIPFPKKKKKERNEIEDINRYRDFDIYPPTDETKRDVFNGVHEWHHSRVLIPKSTSDTATTTKAYENYLEFMNRHKNDESFGGSPLGIHKFMSEWRKYSGIKSVDGAINITLAMPPKTIKEIRNYGIEESTDMGIFDTYGVSKQGTREEFGEDCSCSDTQPVKTKKIIRLLKLQKLKNDK